jgi:HEAT repeat protein
VPEATPNPRTIRFITPPIHDGPSRWYASAVDADDPRVAQLFAASSQVANVLVGPTFVAIGLHRPDAWEELLDVVLRVVTNEFAPAATPEPEPPDAAVSPRVRTSDTSETAETRTTALDRAWRALRALRPEDPHDLEQILDASSATDGATRQIAARVLLDADAHVAEAAWRRLLDDPSRSVRRATVDAMVDASRPELRTLLERALQDIDAWTRWKALRGLVDLGIEPSRRVVAPLVEDPDFRVRLESARALRNPQP